MKTLNETNTKFTGAMKDSRPRELSLSSQSQSGMSKSFLQTHSCHQKLQKQQIWEWTPYWQKQHCFKVIIVSKIQKKTWVPKWRSWSHNCGLFPGETKAAIVSSPDPPSSPPPIQNTQGTLNGKRGNERPCFTESQLWPISMPPEPGQPRASTNS